MNHTEKHSPDELIANWNKELTVIEKRYKQLWEQEQQVRSRSKEIKHNVIMAVESGNHPPNDELLILDKEMNQLMAEAHIIVDQRNLLRQKTKMIRAMLVKILNTEQEKDLKGDVGSSGLEVL